MKSSKELLEEIEALIAQKMKENPEEMKRRLKEIEEAKKAPKIDPQLTQELIEELDKGGGLNIQKVKDLIKRGVDIKTKAKIRNVTVLHFAALFNDVEFAKECIQSGISVDAKDMYGVTPLHVAIIKEDNLEIVKFLIENGADINVRLCGKTPYDLAQSLEMKALLKK